jgi:hypothetical protein
LSNLACMLEPLKEEDGKLLALLAVLSRSCVSAEAIRLAALN